MKKHLLKRLVLSGLTVAVLSAMSLTAFAEDGENMTTLPEESLIYEEAAGTEVAEDEIVLPEESLLCEDAAGDGLEADVDGVVINDDNFNYPTFRSFVRSRFDLNKDGILSEAEAAEVTSISYSESKRDVDANKDVTGIMKGLEFFPELKTLHFSTYSIPSINISSNSKLELLDLEHRINEIDLTYSPNLKEFTCNDTAITELDFSNNPNLKVLHCSNNSIRVLDMSHNPKLEILYFANNPITTLDISKCTMLKTLSSDCGYGKVVEGNIKTLDLSDHKDLEVINLDHLGLKSLKLGSKPVLTELTVSYNKLTELDVTQYPTLKVLGCGDNSIQSLDLSNNKKLKRLYCFGNKLNALDVSNNSMLAVLNCSDNKLTGLNLEKNTKLSELYCSNNTLTSLKLENSTKLSELDCSNNKLTSLKLEKHTILRKMSCFDNELTKLDISRTNLLEDDPYVYDDSPRLGYERKYDHSVSVYMTPYQMSNYFYGIGRWYYEPIDDMADNIPETLLTSQAPAYDPIGILVDAPYNRHVNVYTVAFKSGKLGTNTYAYNGKNRTPSVIIKDNSGKTLIEGTEYTVTYPAKRKDVGTYKLTVKGKGAYSFSKTYTFKINPISSNIKKLSAGKNSIKVTWRKRTTQVKGYEIQYSTSSTFKSGSKYARITSNTKTSKTIKKLKRHKKYYFRIRTYKVIKGKTYTSAWSKKKSVTTK